MGIQKMDERLETIPLGLYRHFKGNYYQVLGLARHSETLEELVVYQALYGSYGIWVRPIKMFADKVSFGDLHVPRFLYIGTTITDLPKVS